LSLFDFCYFRMWREAWIYATARQKRLVVAYHVAFVGASAISLAIPWLVGRVVDTLQKAGPDLLAQSARLLLEIMGCGFALWCLHGPARVVERRVAREIYMQFMERGYARVTELPLSWHQDHHSGSTINRISTAGAGLLNFIGSGFAGIATFNQLVGSIIMLLAFSPALGAFTLLGFILAISVIVALNHRMMRAMHDVNETAHTANATFYDFVSNIVSIVILRLQAFSRLTLRRKLELAMPPWMTQVKLNELRYFAFSIMSDVITAGILLGYIWMQLRAGNAVGAGALVTIYLYLQRISEQGFFFLGVHSDWLGELTNMEATRPIFDDHARLAGRAEVHPPADWYKLEVRHLYFSHGARAALSDVTLPMRHGERIALIGGSGAGKSTLLSLLRALHAPQSAELYLDGAKTDFGMLAQLTTLIPQDPEIFENTIRFNVSFGLDVPDDAVLEALKLAEFTDVLAQLPAGLDTDIREKGVNLSVGQKQRLALARGLFAAEQSDIILLDEPTSSVDLPTEEKIFGNIFTHFQGKTVVATLHRLHLLPRFDRILYLENGRIVSDLPASESLQQPGPIRDLYRMYQKSHAE